MAALGNRTSWSLQRILYSQHDAISFAMRECVEQMHHGDHFNFEHPSNASSWSKLYIRKPVAQPSESEVNQLLIRSMTGVRPRGSVGAAWQAMKNTNGKSKTDGVGDALPTIDSVGKTQSGCDLEGKACQRAEDVRRREEEEGKLEREEAEVQQCDIEEKAKRGQGSRQCETPGAGAT